LLREELIQLAIQENIRRANELPRSDLIDALMKLDKPATASEFEQPMRLKYNHKHLSALLREELVHMAMLENIKNATKMSQRDLIEALMRIEEPVKPLRPEQPYQLELLSRCESEFKNAPWLGTDKKIVGMAVNPTILPEYSTGVNVGPGWFKVTSTWYKEACAGNRQPFITNATAYVTIDKQIILETVDMYNASLLFKPQHTPKSKITVGKESMAPAEPELPLIELAKIEQRQQEGIKIAHPTELAPGLFTQVRLLISGQTFYCNECNISVKYPPTYKSVHGGRKISFCSSACFDAYKFGESESRFEL
jgi:hypothetical protein